MLVAALVPLDKRRSKVFLEEGGVFVLYKGELERYGIKESSLLSEEQYKEIVDQILTKRARERTLYLLKYGDKTESEIRKKLREGFYPETVIDRTLEFLREYRFVADEDYGRRYIRTYGKSRSKQRLCFELRQKGLDRELIGTLLEEEAVEEEGQIRRFLQKKGYKKEEASPRDKAKLAAALSRRGYSYDAIAEGLESGL